MLAACILLFAACDKTPDADELSEQCVRIHIRANSNSQEDQAVKLKVRDAVTDYLTHCLDKADTKQDALDILNREKNALTAIADSVLSAYGFTYGAAAEIGTERFPERSYGGYVFPEGDYQALVLELGSGEGDNWWCVAFPPLCFVPDGDGEKVVYKSWIKEKLDEMF